MFSNRAIYNAHILIAIVSLLLSLVLGSLPHLPQLLPTLGFATLLLVTFSLDKLYSFGLNPLVIRFLIICPIFLLPFYSISIDPIQIGTWMYLTCLLVYLTCLSLKLRRLTVVLKNTSIVALMIPDYKNKGDLIWDALLSTVLPITEEFYFRLYILVLFSNNLFSAYAASLFLFVFAHIGPGWARTKYDCEDILIMYGTAFCCMTLLIITGQLWVAILAHLALNIPSIVTSLLQVQHFEDS